MIKKGSEEGLPRISVVMPSFNGAKYIDRAIKSVVLQDYPDFELFIKDGGSTDGTVEIIKQNAKKYPGKIKWVSKKDNGQADAINYGIKETKGQIVAYLNADDIYKPGAFKIVGKYFQKKPGKMWLIGRSDIINEKDKQIRKLITSYKNFWLNNYSYNTLLILNYISQMGVFWRREVIEKIGLFDASQYYVMDYDYWLRLGKSYTPGRIDKYLASFRIISSSKSSMGFVKQFSDEYKVAKKYTNNRIILNLHLLHNKMITSIYRTMESLTK